MRHAGAVLFAAALAACSPPASQSKAPEGPSAETAISSATSAVPAACMAQSSRDWSAVGSQYYIVEAEASGDTCADASATMRIKSTEGAVLFTRTYPVRNVPLAFNPTDDQTGLRSDLEGWTQNTADPATADILPAWPAGAQRPPNFQPAVPRNRYEAARGAQGPLFCFPDGAESNACVSMTGDTATYLGSWTPESE